MSIHQTHEISPQLWFNTTKQDKNNSVEGCTKISIRKNIERVGLLQTTITQ